MIRDRFWLTDVQFAKLAPHLPADTRGKARVNDQRVISGIVHVLKSGMRWIDVVGMRAAEDALQPLCRKCCCGLSCGCSRGESRLPASSCRAAAATRGSAPSLPATRTPHDLLFGARRCQRSLFGQPPPGEKLVGETPRRRATRLTVTSGSRVSVTISSFSETDHGRRPWGSVRISAFGYEPVIDTALLLTLILGVGRVRAIRGLRHAGCWSNLRREFYKLHVEGVSHKATWSVQRMANLWALEAQIKGQKPAGAALRAPWRLYTSCRRTHGPLGERTA
jgi:hypothetical protein